jgi:hypothetical protein
MKVDVENMLCEILEYSHTLVMGYIGGLLRGRQICYAVSTMENSCTDEQVSY